MKIKIGNKEYGFNFKDVIYILGLVAMGAGWFVDHKLTKFKNEMKDQMQDEKIALLEEKNDKLKFENEKQKEYVKENSDNIVWIVRVIERVLD